MKRIILLITTAVLAASLCLGQSAGDYRSAATGNWNSTATWEYYNGTAWVPATSTPTSASGVITIRNGHTVTVTANVTVDQVVVETGGQVSVNANRTLTIANGSGTDFICYGVLYNSGTITTTGTLSFGSGATYQHARNGGTIPTAAWDVNSTCLVTGITNTAPGGLGQTFGNFTWNCAGQSAIIDVAALTTIAGNFNIVSTGSPTIRRLNRSSGDLTVSGNFSQSGGTFDPGSGYGAAQRFNLNGNFICTGDTFRNNTGGGQLIVVFRGTNQTFLFNGIMINPIDFIIRPGTTLTLNSNFPVNTGATLTDSGSLNTGSYIVSGGGSFTLPAGGTLGIGSSQGITTLGTAAGNIQTTTARNYSSQADYIYNGTSVQVTGTGLPSSVNNLTINNSSGVTLTNSVTVDGTLSLENGILATGGNTITISNSGAVSRTNGWVNGNLAKVIPAGPQSRNFEVGTTNGYSPVNVSIGNVTTSGTLTARAVASVHGSVYLPHQCLQRYWTLTNSGLVFSSYDATFSYLPGDFNVGFLEAADEGSMVVGKFQSGSWTLPAIGTRSPGGGSDGGSIQIVGQTSFSDFTLAKNGYSLDAALAVSLSSFSAQGTEGGVTLSWRTESENGSYQWLVERSESESGPFEELVRLPAAGTSQVPKDYSWSDVTARAGVTYYYRIGELSQDGRLTYFGPVSCSLGRGMPQVDLALGCAPNPFAGSTYIKFQIPKAGNISLKVYNVAGQCVRSLVSDLRVAGSHLVRWDGRDDEGGMLSAGVYMLKLDSPDGSLKQRLVLIR